jgi:hypothetical protein
MVTGIVALDRVKRTGGRRVARVIAAVESSDTRVAAMKLADRLHNMQTIRFLPQAKQLRKARESLDVFVPVSEQLHLPTVTSELETLASATLTRRQVAGHGLLRQPLILRRPAAHQRTIVALDIERSTSRPDPVKAELRATMYDLFDAALRAARIHPRHRDRFADRGDGFLALIHGVDHSPEVLLRRVIPAYGVLLPSTTPSARRKASCGSASLSTPERCSTTPTGASARPWTPPSACSTPLASSRCCEPPRSRSPWSSRRASASPSGQGGSARPVAWSA